jgi:hypothetical protein
MERHKCGNQEDEQLHCWGCITKGEQGINCIHAKKGINCISYFILRNISSLNSNKPLSVLDNFPISKIPRY